MNHLMNICSKCNIAFRPEEKVCPNCGSTELSKLIRPDTVIEIQKNKDRKRNIMMILLWLFVGGVVIYASWRLLIWIIELL